jgi:hypothetical protein
MDDRHLGIDVNGLLDRAGQLDLSSGHTELLTCIGRAVVIAPEDDRRPVLAGQAALLHPADRGWLRPVWTNQDARRRWAPSRCDALVSSPLAISPRRSATGRVSLSVRSSSLRRRRTASSCQDLSLKPLMGSGVSTRMMLFRAPSSPALSNTACRSLTAASRLSGESGGGGGAGIQLPPLSWSKQSGTRRRQ